VRNGEGISAAAEEKLAAINSAAKNAKPQNTSATVEIAFFDDCLPKKPLIAAPASGRSGTIEPSRATGWKSATS